MTVHSTDDLPSSPADIDAVKPQRHGAGRRSRWDLRTLRELWRFKDYGRPERKSLVLGVLMNGGQMAANLAAPWPGPRSTCWIP